MGRIANKKVIHGNVVTVIPSNTDRFQIKAKNKEEANFIASLEHLSLHTGGAKPIPQAVDPMTGSMTTVNAILKRYRDPILTFEY